MKPSKILGAVMGVQMLLTATLGAASFAEIKQLETRYNLRKTNGVPISSTPGTPVGSDGRGPTLPGPQSSNPATANQFQGFYPGGAGVTVTMTNVANLDTNLSLVANAENLNLPRGKVNGTIVAVLHRARIGGPVLSRAISFSFGAVIPPPVKDENGVALTNTLNASYWFAEPHTTNAHAGVGYYWSKHAGSVFATKAGPIDITWKKLQPEAATPGDATNTAKWYTDAGNYYRLHLVRYVASGTAVKPPQQMYWTEGVFRDLGKPVNVPAARVSTVKVVYNNNFPGTVAEEFVGEGQSYVAAATNRLQELRTLWYDDTQKQVRAYNAEGRVFVELLGDSAPDGQTKQWLGFEIVDVSQQANPAAVVTDLGEQLHAYPDSPDDRGLFPEMANGNSFVYQVATPGSDRQEFHATRETENQNDVLIHWLKEGLQGIRWPARLVRYRMIWPTDVAKYSHYVRPLVATDAEARLTAVALPTDNVPVIDYQDAFDRPRAALTEQFGFYTFLDATVPAHRTLLRFNAGENFRFERVFSWLDANLKTTNFANTVAANLAPVADYLAFAPTYPAAYSNYTAYLSERTRGVNGGWKLHVTDDAAADANGGNIDSWQLLVITTNSATRLLATNVFTSAGNISIPGLGQATPYPSTLSVSGVTEAVAAIQVQLNGFTHASPVDVDAFLVGPRSNVCAIISDAGAGIPGVTNVTLLIGDEATLNVGQALAVANGSYLPTDYETGEALPPNSVGSIGTSLAALLLPAVPEVADPRPFLTPWPNQSVAPRVVGGIVEVGQRIVAPPGELGDTGTYLAGHVRSEFGTSYHPTAYVDPLAAGFDAANLGAIIPVNAIPGNNALEVWWFRKNTVDLAKGFKNTYWPSVIGRYVLQWPANPREIVLASNDGSGGLSSLEAKGTIYTQNDPAFAGYNPNEEHALMLSGQAYALRDDLNLTNATIPAVLAGSGATYSSRPFVLLDYTESDGRPAMSPFKVLREKPSAGILFDYITEAGSLLQAPMPLPLLAVPVEGVGAGKTNFNHETTDTAGDVPLNFAAGDTNGPFKHYPRFTYRDRKDGFWVYRGSHQGLPPLAAGKYDPVSRSFLPLDEAAAVTNQTFTEHLHVSRRAATLQLSQLDTLPAGLVIDGLTLTGVPSTVGTNTISLRLTDTGDGSAVTNTFVLTVRDSGTVISQGPLVLASTNGQSGTVTSFTNRPPYLAASPRPTNSFSMRFYYKTQAGFAWPGSASPAPVGAIVPYLRPRDTNGVFVGAADAKATAALDIVYRPTWPATAPTLAPGQTLTGPVNGLPAVRGQSSALVLYQQSIGTNLTTRSPSVTLYDPTRVKSFAFTTNGPLTKVPAGVNTDSYQGKIYFPNLPPHLAQRVFFDPNRGVKGSLVLQGEFKDELVGEKYLHLNVLGAADLVTVKALCPTGDPAKASWDSAIVQLSTTMETFKEDPAVPGTFIVDATKTETVTSTNIAAVKSADTAVDSYALSANGPGTGFVTLIVGEGQAFTPPADPVSVYVLRVGGSLYRGELKVLPSANPLSELLTMQHTADLAANTADFEYDWRIAGPVDGQPLALTTNMLGWQPLVNTNRDVPRYTLGGANIQVLGDNYLTMRYRAANTNHPLFGQWSDWTEPQLAEGWIKRVLAGINPFNQRTSDLFNNTVNTDANILTAAGKRWEGDVALNLANINNYGLIEIYETVLRRGKLLSTDAGINYGPANDALLLAAGYLNDLYMMVGNEAWADAANPTIGIGSKDNTYGDIASALFAFKGQLPTLLEEELALLRGRDDELQPGVETRPVYNRLVWNYTRGIDSGEVIYALNYNILDQNTDGKTDATDAAALFPQGHGDAFGHYLTALKGYYSLLLDTDFDWVPRIEAVTILGKAVSVDYQDERKFAAAAAAAGRAGRQILDLTWRQSYQAGDGIGWEHLAVPHASSARTNYWGVDHWATRTGQGTYLNWVIGNAIVPDVDPDPSHAGIQKIDRSTIPELAELAGTLSAVQATLDNAEGHLTPLGLPAGGLAFDLNPDQVVGVDSKTHFEQIYERAEATLNNAVASFDDAKDVTRLMRSEQDSLFDLQTTVAEQELAYTNALIELFGTPYPEDIGPGKTYEQGYAGPDFFHHAYVDNASPITTAGHSNNSTDFQVSIQPSKSLASAPKNTDLSRFTRYGIALSNDLRTASVTVRLDSHGFFAKPATYVSRRVSPGKLQEAISRITQAHTATLRELEDNRRMRYLFNLQVDDFNSQVGLDETLHKYDTEKAIAITTAKAAIFAGKMIVLGLDTFTDRLDDTARATVQAIPSVSIFGLANGGDIMAPAKGAILAASAAAKIANDTVNFAKEFAIGALEITSDAYYRQREADFISPLQRGGENQARVVELAKSLEDMRLSVYSINQRYQELQDAVANYQSLLAQGDRILAERQTFRQRAAAVVQGYRTRDAAFRIFRNEKLERYKTLFDLAARYSYLAANAYDYETGLLDTAAGRSFVQRIISSRALGVVKDGQPQYAGSNTGDPGLSSALAEMKADWDVLRGRLGFNSPDAYGTTVSLRTENLRILPAADSNETWQDVLQKARVENLMDDPDVRRHCLQIDPGDGLPVPGIVLTFSTTIAPGRNLFGQAMAGGDHSFELTAFATKIAAVGVAFPGYRGMDDPVANTSTTTGSTGDPTTAFLDPLSLAANPGVYLIPVGVDSMRSPPLGDTSTVRTWNVNDIAIPLPFNIGASDFSTKNLYQSSDSLTEALFSIRKHQAFRPVSTAEAFSSDIYGDGGTLQASQFTNRRLIGRSVWNSHWKLVIPGYRLLNDPKEGLERFIRTVTDVHLHFVTYSYSGN